MIKKVVILSELDNLKIEVSDDGNIYSLDKLKVRKNGRYDNRRGKKLSPKIDKYGYEKVSLTNNGKRKEYSVHRLVAMAFIPNLENKPTINHKNGIKTDNRIENLEWATHKEQTRHAIDTGLLKISLNGLKKSNAQRRKAIVYKGRKYESIADACRCERVNYRTIKKYGKLVMHNE